MPLYEHIFIARQDVSGAQVDQLVETFTGVVETGGGKVVDSESWGLRNLAYRIKKNRKGHYVMMNLDAPSDVILELERQQRIHDDVLRYLTLRMDEHEEMPSVMMQGRKDRPRRIRLESGDVVVWGGPSRLVYHGVAPLADGDDPLTGGRRINLTLRKAR